MGPYPRTVFLWLLTREEAEQRGSWESGLSGGWRRLGGSPWDGGGGLQLQSALGGDAAWGTESDLWDPAAAGPSSTALSTTAVRRRPVVHFSSGCLPDLSSWPSTSTWPSVGPSTRPAAAGPSFRPAAAALSSDSLAIPSENPSTRPKPEARVTGDLEPSPPSLELYSAAEASPSSGSGDGFTPADPGPAETSAAGAVSPGMVTLQLPVSPRSSQTASLYTASEGGMSSDDADGLQTSPP